MIKDLDEFYKGRGLILDGQFVGMYRREYVNDNGGVRLWVIYTPSIDKMLVTTGFYGCDELILREGEEPEIV